MVVSLSYDFSTFFLMEESSWAKILGRPSMFKSVKRPYVFTIVLLSYPMYLHDSSCFSPGIGVYEAPFYLLEEELSLDDFSESAVW
jgi:hypothetical protein